MENMMPNNIIKQTQPLKNLKHTCSRKTLRGDNLVVFGDGNQIFGDNCTIFGNENKHNGKNSFIKGNNNKEFGDDNMIEGDANLITGKGNIIKGKNNIFDSLNNKLLKDDEEVPINTHLLTKPENEIKCLSAIKIPDFKPKKRRIATPLAVIDIRNDTSNSDSDGETSSQYQSNFIIGLMLAREEILSTFTAINGSRHNNEHDGEQSKRRKLEDGMYIYVPANKEQPDVTEEEESAGLQCKVCLIKPYCTTNVPCGHMCVCIGCARKLGSEPTPKCPICKQKLEQVVLTFKT